MKIYIDTCIVLDFFDTKRLNYKKAQNFFDICSKNNYSLFISSKAISDIYFMLRRTFDDNKKIKEIIYTVSKIVTIVDTYTEDVMNALDLPNKDYEDSIVIQIAKSNGIDIVVTDNVSDFNKDLINVYSLEKFIEKYN